MQAREVSRFEQHFGAITQAIVVALLVWTGTSLIGLREQVAVMEVKVTSVQAAMAQETIDTYSKSEASREFSFIRSDISRLEKRIERLEHKAEINGSPVVDRY